MIIYDKNDRREAINEILDRYGPEAIYDNIINAYHAGAGRELWPGSPGTGDIDDLVDDAAENPSNIYDICCEAYDRGFEAYQNEHC